MESRSNDLYSLLIDRLYHEDNLLSNRTSNFITFNAFLATALALSFATDQIGSFGYIIMVFGLVLAVFQAFLGERSVRAIHFWREYTHLFEKDSGTNFDRALFVFYQFARVDTSVGTIKKARSNQRPMAETFPWNLRFPFTDRPIMPTPNVLMGVSIPWLVAFFWLSVLLAFLYYANSIGGMAAVAIPFLLCQ